MRITIAAGTTRKELENARVIPAYAANIAAIREPSLTQSWLEG